MSSAIVSCATLHAITWLNGATYSPADALAIFRYRLVDQPQLASYLRSCLNPDEITRVNRFHQESDRLRFTHARGILRLLLSKHLNQRPETIVFVPGVNKKPEVYNQTDLHFNVSHSGDWILLAIGQVAVGVDVEKVSSDMAYEDIVMHSFSQQEQQHVAWSSDARFAFYHLWTRKEALVKATAKGIVDELNQVPSLDGQHHTTDDLIGQAGDWTVYSLTIDPRHAAAIAYKSPARLPSFYTLDASLFV